MKVTVNKVDEANVIVSGTIANDVVEAYINTMAAQAGKEMKVDGFRKGKVPPHVVKKLHGDKLAQDAEGEALKELIDLGIKEAGINAADMLGQPTFVKYDKKDDGIEVEVEVSVKPVFDLEGYMDVLPAFEKPAADQKEIDEKLNEIASGNAPYEKIKRKRMVRDGDMTLIDFEGFVDGTAFDGGQAEKFSLKIGSKQFIPGFEEQIIGMKYEEEKDVVVTFPAEYQSADLAGKEATFKVTLHEIQEQGEVEINDELAKKLLQGEENPTVEMLTERVKSQIESAAISKLYNEDLKPKIVEALVAKFDFALPNNIVAQEVDAKVNAKAQEMTEEELNSFKDAPEKVDALRDEVREDAKASVKATFIVDALAKKEEVTVDDQEVTSALYYEAMMSGQDAQEIIKYYEENNLLPAVKMGMIEDKLFGKMLGLEG
ncbi:trigger factor [Sulfurovum sp.]|uniref:trigger factor n=1 Tax=Sulfurovum sp. TaxID=1969726 RepID=UPI0028681F8C|nr:trigger factor [Sulfurovum sp.]